MPPMYCNIHYATSLLFPLSRTYSEHDNTLLVCNKQWYVPSWTFYWCCDVDLYHPVWGCIIMLFDLFIFLSWPMWWTCAFTPTQPVSWQLECTCTHCSTFSLIGKHMLQDLVRNFVTCYPCRYLSSPFFHSFSPIYSEHNTLLVWYVTKLNNLLVLWWYRPSSDRLHDHVV